MKSAATHRFVHKQTRNSETTLRTAQENPSWEANPYECVPWLDSENIHKMKEAMPCRTSKVRTITTACDEWSENRCNMSELDHAVTVVAFPRDFLYMCASLLAHICLDPFSGHEDVSRNFYLPRNVPIVPWL